MKVQIISTETSSRSFPAKEGRAAITFKEQKAAVLRNGDFPLPFKFSLDEDQPPYPVGEYELCPTSLESGQYGGLEFGRRIILIPVVANPLADQKGGKPAAANA